MGVTTEASFEPDKKNYDGGTTRQYNESFESPPIFTKISTYLSYIILLLFGYLSNFLARRQILKHGIEQDPLEKKGFAPLLNRTDLFFTRFMYRRIRDCWNRPIGSCPGSTFEVLERESPDYNWTFKRTGRRIEALNLGSYNYLGFAEHSGNCSDEAKEAIRTFGLANANPRQDYGSSPLQLQLESQVAQFLGVEDAITFPMGFATNALNLPVLAGKGSLILSDELNHCSIVLGCRNSGATVWTFKHNDMTDLERKILEGIRSKAFNKILIVVEGLYSMEGSLTKLPDVIRLKKRYKCYLYLDEAHSIGAVGPTGRGVVELYGCEAKDVDILMGTFTKSFGSAGGYIAGSKRLIDLLRAKSHASVYAASMSPPVAAQSLAAFKALANEDGLARIRRLAWNARYFRYHLHRLGFIVFGSRESPIVPLLLYQPAKVAAFSREMLRRKVAVVVVGYPATNLIEARARFCLSASHTKQQLDEALRAIDEVGDMLRLKHSSRPASVRREIDYYVNYEDAADIEDPSTYANCKTCIKTNNNFRDKGRHE